MRKLDERVLQLASAQLGNVTRKQAYGLGATRAACDRRVASGAWLLTAHAGVYRLVGWKASWLQRICAAVLAAGDGAAASHRAAAVLHGIREGTPIELTIPRSARNNVSGVLLAHRADLPDRDRTTVTGIPVTRVERTLVDLAGVVGDDACEQALEAALRARLTTPERVRERVEELAAPGRRGVRRLRRALERRAAGRPPGSELEVRTIQLLRAAGLGDPVRQHEVRLGGERYFLDLAYVDRRLAIELDGQEFHGEPAFQRDRTRQNALVLAGWTVLRFTWADVVERPEQVVALVSRALAA
jgi:very-short-patch-repair endonuclease